MSTPSLEQHLRAMLDKRLGQPDEALKQARRARGVEAVHDLRVASRRLRAFGVTFEALLPAKTRRRLEKRLKRVTRAAGPLRDLDVQLELLKARRAAASVELEQAALEHLLEQLEARRERCLRRAERRLDAVALGSIQREVWRAARAVEARLAERDVAQYARSVLGELVADAAAAAPERAAAGERSEDPERLHRLRIEVKELRYALELFEPVLGARFEPLHERATALQELLGAHHDLVVLGELASERRAELRERQRDTLARGLDLALEALGAERAAALGRYHEQGFDAESWRAELAPPLDGAPL